MDPLLFAAFLTATVAFLAVPGSSVAFATAQALRHGSRAAVVAVAGDALGTTVHVGVAAAGLTALVSLSTLVLPFLQIVGGLFLLRVRRERALLADGASLAVSAAARA